MRQFASDHAGARRVNPGSRLPHPAATGYNLDHAAVSNPEESPFEHNQVRERLGLRPGGFGILMTDQLVDELVYNERRNEVMFIKYL